MKAGLTVSVAVILISAAIGIWLYPQLPDPVASHWNINGEADGFMPRFWGVFLMPIISVLLLALFIAVPAIDPLKANIQKFRGYFDGFIALLMLFLFYISLLVIFWNLGARFNMIQALSPAFAALFFFCGILVSHAERNWFIGIRTPWTLSSERVWKKTHKLGGRLFKASGVLSLLGVILPAYAIFFILAPVLFTAVYAMAYSYFEFRKEKR